MMLLSCQSRVAYGHVGNAAAVFALQRLGHEVIAIDTVSLAHHQGYGPAPGRVIPADELSAQIDGLAAIGALDRVDAILSGYLGTRAAGAVVLHAVKHIRARRPGAFYVCDPVIGDRDKGMYVAEDLARFFASEALVAADLITPNHFELEILTGRPLPRLADVLAALGELRTRGPRSVAATSVVTAEGDAATLTTIGLDASGAWQVATPRLPTRAKGAGDLFTALLTAHLCGGRPLTEALAESVSAVYAVIEQTAAAGADELCLIAAQGALLRPPRRFAARPLQAGLRPPS
jgi:pyridoxine kinase